MAIILALEKLYDDCVSRFALDGTFGDVAPADAAARAANPFGWREPQRQAGGRSAARIVWVPGDDTNGSVGAIAPPKYPGRIDPGRPLGTLEELFTVYVSGADDPARENERAQYHATRLLYDAWYRAVYLAAHGTFRIVSQSWVIGASAPRSERRYGAAIRITGAIQAMIPDSTPTLAAPPLEADITPLLNSTADPVEIITP